jgi:CRISPR/Cas system CSM-associated protein Csm3 (group 7 of RAMP superfamily)
MPITYVLNIKLLSDTTFGRGDGLAGLVDQEVEYDASGFPYLRGRTLKGLFTEECDNYIAAIVDQTERSRLEDAACHLFGAPGSALSDAGKLSFGDACLPQDLRLAVQSQIEAKEITVHEVLNSLTTIRRQTAIDDRTGIANRGSLRSTRVILKDLTFQAHLYFQHSPDDAMKQVLAIGAFALRRVGTSRNRGRGKVQCTLHDDCNRPLMPFN